MLKKWSFKEEYDTVLKEYIQLSHMEKVTKTVEDDYYLPHHAVIKPENTSTKVRDEKWCFSE